MLPYMEHLGTYKVDFYAKSVGKYISHSPMDPWWETRTRNLYMFFVETVSVQSPKQVCVWWRLNWESDLNLVWCYTASWTIRSRDTSVNEKKLIVLGKGPTFQFLTPAQQLILLMVQKSGVHHLLSMKPYEKRDILHINWLAGFLNHQQYHKQM